MDKCSQLIVKSDIKLIMYWKLYVQLCVVLGKKKEKKIGLKKIKHKENFH